MSKVKIELPGSDDKATMIACDGRCGAFIGKALEQEARHTTADGRKGHVCSETCAIAFEQDIPSSDAVPGHPQFVEPEETDEIEGVVIEHPGIGPNPWPEGVPLPDEDA